MHEAQLYMRAGSVPEALLSLEQGLQPVDYAKSLSSTGLLHSRYLNEKYASFANHLMSLHFAERRYRSVLEIFDRNKASLLLSLISEWDDFGTYLSEKDRTRLEELKTQYQHLRYELDVDAGKIEVFTKLKEEFKKVKQEIDRIVNVKKDVKRANILAVSWAEMVELVNRKNMVGIVFFCTGVHERMREDSSKLLHAICLCNGEVTGYVGNDELKYSRSPETRKLFS